MTTKTKTACALTKAGTDNCLTTDLVYMDDCNQIYSAEDLQSCDFEGQVFGVYKLVDVVEVVAGKARLESIVPKKVK